MKKTLALLVLAVVSLTMAGCGSLRTPSSGPRADKVYYTTFFGISIESAACGDGILPR